MFEEEKDIYLHDDKRIRYIISYVKNIIRYYRKKVYIPLLEIWGNNQCNLRCRECIGRIPFIHEESMDADKVANSLIKLFQIADMDKVVISGGEPFLNGELHKIVRCINSLSDVKKIFLFTNGKVVPNEELLSALAESKKQVKVIINEYQREDRQICDLRLLLKRRRIPYHIRKLGKYHWRRIGNEIQKPFHFETGRMIYADCRLRNHAVLYEDIITKCPRGVLVRKQCDSKEKSMDYVGIDKLKNTAFSRARLAACLDNSIHKEYCRKCYGVSGENPYLEKPGIQIGSCSDEDVI